MRTKGKIILITGEIRGVSEHIIKTLSEHPDMVVFTDNTSSAVLNVISRFGRIDCLINNVGMLSFSKDKMPPYCACQSAVLSYMRECLPYLKQIRGSILNIVPDISFISDCDHMEYAALKEGVFALTRSAAKDWGEFGINVNALSIVRQKDPDPENDCFDGVGDICMFLTSDASNYITGETIRLEY